MNIQTPTPSTELVEIQTLVPAIVFGPGGVEKIIKDLTDKVLAIPTDISTATGRKAIASLAYKVARSKTALDEMGKELAADLKRQTNAIDAERRTIRDRLDALQEQVRKPLTDWENAEKQRVADHEAALLAITESPLYGARETSAEVRARLDYLTNYPARDWQEFAERARKTLDAEIARTRDILATVEKRESEAAELERLRAERIAREQAERDARIAAEAAERARREAEDKAARAQALADAKAREAREKAEREKAAAEQAARQAEERARKAEADRIAAEQKAKADAEAAAAKAERDRHEAIEAERKRVADEKAAQAREAAKREANKKHRDEINRNAKQSFVACGMAEDAAELAVALIAQGAIPNVAITY